MVYNMHRRQSLTEMNTGCSEACATPSRRTTSADLPGDAASRACQRRRSHPGTMAGIRIVRVTAPCVTYHCTPGPPIPGILRLDIVPPGPPGPRMSGGEECCCCKWRALCRGVCSCCCRDCCCPMKNICVSTRREYKMPDLKNMTYSTRTRARAHTHTHTRHTRTAAICCCSALSSS